jgi:malonyl-CoA decarboxylase
MTGHPLSSANLGTTANFHMKNGAIMYRLNWRADLSPRGLANSCGIMINYRYYLDQYEVNGRRYQVDKVIPASESFQQILQHQV